MNIEQPEPATFEDAKDTFAFLDSPECKEMLAKWEEEDKKLRSMYLDNPKRKQTFEYDFVEALWMHMVEYYGKAVGDEEIGWMLDEIIEDCRIWELVYDVAQKYAETRDWEMIV
jgi:hypothetical protein